MDLLAFFMFSYAASVVFGFLLNLVTIVSASALVIKSSISLLNNLMIVAKV